MRMTTLGIPILVGLVAAGLNFYVLNQRDPPAKYLRVKERVPAGTVLTDEMLEVVELSGPPDTIGQLGRTAVPAGDRALVVGRPALRDLQTNDVVLWRDFNSARGELSKPALPVSLEGLNMPERLLQVGDEIGFVIRRPGETGPSGGLAGPDTFEEVGPFRVASIGDLTVRRELDSKEKAAAERDITVEMEYDPANPKKLAEKVEKLLAARGTSTNDQRGPRIVGVVLHPKPRGGGK